MALVEPETPGPVFENGAVGPDGLVTAGSCRQCLYSLVGLRATGGCPECAFSIASSLSGGYSSQQYTHTLVKGMWLVQGTLIVSVACIVGLCVLMPFDLTDEPYFAVSVCLVISQLNGLVGLCLIGTPEKRVAAGDSDNYIQALVIAEIALWVVFFATPLAALLIVLVRWARAAALSTRLRRIASRIGDVELKKRARVCQVVCVLSPLLLFTPLILAWTMMFGLLRTLRRRLTALAESMPPDAPGPAGAGGHAEGGSTGV